jgi:Lrp/AsnC family transcriptional regulator
VITDETDLKILKLLQRDSDVSLDAIGERVHLSRNACWRRIKALETSGVIKRRVALLDADKLGLPLVVMMMVRTQEHSEEWAERFRAATRDMPEILGVYRMTGDLDYLIRARVADMADYDRLYRNLIGRVALSDVSASFVMEEIKDTHCLPL